LDSQIDLALAADLAELTAACSLPAVGDRLPKPPRPARQTKSPPALRDQMNTYAVRKRRRLTEAEREVLNRAELALWDGAISHTRMMCRYIKDTTHAPEAYLCLGRTYDPEKLKELGVHGIPSDAAMAQFYYGKAAQALKQVPVDAPHNLMNEPPIGKRRALTAAERRILNRAELALSDGAIYNARMICRHLRDTTHAPEAYLCLGRTYDPEKLKELGVLGIPSDAAKAQFYYGQAARALKQLPDNTPQARATPVLPRAMADATPVSPQVMADADGSPCNASLCKLVDRGDGPAVYCERQWRK
jgi:hypothetical protein